MKKEKILTVTVVLLHLSTFLVTLTDKKSIKLQKVTYLAMITQHKVIIIIIYSKGNFENGHCDFLMFLKKKLII